MIPAQQVHEVESLLSRGAHSQREIARRTGVSRGSIAAIASGSRCPRPLKPIDEPQGPPERCGGCGSLVVHPCRICLARRYKKRILAERREKHCSMEPAADRRQSPLKRPAK